MSRVPAFHMGARSTMPTARRRPLEWNSLPCHDVLRASIGQTIREKQMDQRIVDLYDEYTHAPLERRVFLERLAMLTGSVAAAMAVLPLLENRAVAAVGKPDDPRVMAAIGGIPGQSGVVKGYRVRPAGTQKKLPAIVVIHENRGLSDHIQDVARRFAVAGYLAVAPDFLSPAGGTPSDEDQARELISKLDPIAT